MRFFSGKGSSQECEDSGGHDQRQHKRKEPDGSTSTVVDCVSCGKEWKYHDNGCPR